MWSGPPRSKPRRLQVPQRSSKPLEPLPEDPLKLGTVMSEGDSNPEDVYGNIHSSVKALGMLSRSTFSCCALLDDR